jgi:hypothetical protein
VEVGTPIEIPADPAPELSFDYRISFERQVLDQPGRTIHGFKSELMSESLPTTPRRIYRFSFGKGWTRPTVEFTNTGNVPLAVRVRSVVEVGT